MKNDLIYAIAWKVPGRYLESQIKRMFEVWHSSITKIGGFEGEIKLFTNMEDLREKGIDTRIIESEISTDRELRLQKVKIYEHIEPKKYSSITYMDLDIVAVDEIGSLLAKKKSVFKTAQAEWRVYHPWHTLKHIYMNPYLAKYLLSTKMVERAPSSCFFSISPDKWRDYMSTWNNSIEKYEKKVTKNDVSGILADQSYLNLEYVRGNIDVTKIPSNKILNSGWRVGERVKLLHFPNVNPGKRVEIMEEFYNRAIEARKN